MTNQSIFTKLLSELAQHKNHNTSIERCRQIIKELENKLDKRIIAYFASETGSDAASMINDEDVFLIENLLSIEASKKDLVLIIHSNGGYALSAERIIEVCKNYCARRNDGSKFIVIVLKKAKSAATIVALAADKIYLRDTAELGPVDPQFIVLDKDGNIQIEPAYLYVDAIENIFDIEAKNLLGKILNKNLNDNNKPLSRLPAEVKLKLIEQCNYSMYLNAKNELGL
jgi:ClpP class serine protease